MITKSKTTFSGEQVEEVIAVRVYAQAFLYDAQERQ